MEDGINMSPNSSSNPDEEFKKQPPSVMKEIWQPIDPNLRKELQKLHDDVYPPKGVDEKLWEKCEKEELRDTLRKKSKNYFENSLADSLSIYIIV